MTLIVEANGAGIAQAAERIRAGLLVAMPTETVYGLAADATNDSAVAAIFAAKDRPAINPVIVHYAARSGMEEAVVFNDDAEALAAVFWPGPLTLILPRRENSPLSLLTSAGLQTQAVRIPAHPVARELIRAAGCPLAAPSANASGTLSPTTPQHVAHSLGARAGLILAGGRAAVGLESTVVDLSGPVPLLLRHGAITPDELRAHLSSLEIDTGENTEKPRSPGQLLRHYAPRTPLRLRAVDVAPGEALLAFGPLRFMGIRGGGHAKDLPEGAMLNLSETGDLTEAAANLFALLHRLDAGGFSGIAVMDVPETGLGLAVNDRLRRAAGAQKMT